MIVGIGGGEIKGWSFKTKDNNQYLYQTEKIDKEIVKLSPKAKPKVLFIGTASKENPFYFKAIKDIYENLNCDVDKLELLKEKIDIDKIKTKIFSSDIIYVGGGNTKFMFEEWSKINLDKILLEAYNKGIIMAGFSAGCYCWFDYNYELIEGLKLIHAVVSVHYEEKSEEKRKDFYDAIKNKNLPGIALENGTAIKYFEDNTFEVIKSIETAKAFLIKYIDNNFEIMELEENMKYKI